MVSWLRIPSPVLWSVNASRVIWSNRDDAIPVVPMEGMIHHGDMRHHVRRLLELVVRRNRRKCTRICVISMLAENMWILGYCSMNCSLGSSRRKRRLGGHRRMEASTGKTGISRLEGLMESHAGDCSLKASMSRCHMFSGILCALVVYQHVTPGKN